jgi:hypothetical protein
MLTVPAFAQQADPPSKAGDSAAPAAAVMGAQTARAPATTGVRIALEPTAANAQPLLAIATVDSQPASAPAAIDAQAASAPAPTNAQTAPAIATVDSQPALAPAPTDAQTAPAPTATGAQTSTTPTATSAQTALALATVDAQAAPAPATTSAQTAPAPTATGAQATPAPAKTEQTAAAPAPSPAPSGEEWLTGSIDLGYRWMTGVSGSFPEYRSVVNLGEGLILNGLDFTITDPKKRLFDRVDANASGWGGDPYNSARLNARKQGVYAFTFDYRNIAFFDAVPAYANPLAPGGFDEQSFDTHRRSMSIGLELRPGKSIVPYLVFDRNSGYGNGIDEWVQGSNDEFAVPTMLRDSTNNYRGGVRFEFNHFHITVEQGGTTYKDDDLTNWSGTNDGDRTTTIFGETLDLTSLKQAYGVRGTSVYSKALVTAHPFSWIDLYGQFLYSDPKTTVNFSEAAAGNFLLISQLLFYSSQQTIGTGAANQPHTTGTAGFELRPLKRMRIFESWMTDRYHDAAYPAFSITAGIPLPTGVSTVSPLEVVNYNQEQVDVMYDASSKITLRGGYRHIWGDATTGESPFFDPLGGTEQGKLDRNVGLGGVSFRASQKISFNLDYEGATSDHVYFRTSLNDYQKARARMKYQVLPSLALQSNLSVLNNLNHAPQIQYDFLSRDNSLGVYWTPKSGKHITLVGEYDRSTMHSTIGYLTLPFLTSAVSDYRDNAHTVTAAVDMVAPGTVAAKLTLGGSMLISNGSQTTRYYQPLARFSFPMGRHLSWNTEWKYYGFQQDFYLYESFRTHLIMTGLKFIR